MLQALAESRGHGAAPAVRGNTRGPEDEPEWWFIVGPSVSPTPDAWQQAANVALVLLVLALCAIPCALGHAARPGDDASHYT